MAPADSRTATDLGPPAAEKSAPGEPSVADRLFTDATPFDFFQAVRLLEKLLPNRQPVGRRGPVGAEVVRFRAWQSFNFPPSAIYDLARPTREFPTPTMTVSFMGLTGPSGILPRHYTELVMYLTSRAKGAERYALRDWFDLFNHRLISLFYRAWEKYRFYIPYEREQYDDEEPDAFTTALASIAGIGTRSMRRRLSVRTRMPDGDAKTLAEVDDLSVMYYGGLLGHRPHNASGLKAMLEDYFQQPVEVRQFQGQWLWLEPDTRTRLGDVLGNCQLGTSAVAGERLWDVQSKFRVRLGPLDYRAFAEMLPDRSPIRERKAFFLLSHLIRLYVGPEFDFDVQLLLRPEGMPECQLGAGEGLGARLGWNTWLITTTPERVVDDVVLEGTQVFAVG